MRCIGAPRTIRISLPRTKSPIARPSSTDFRGPSPPPFRRLYHTYLTEWYSTVPARKVWFVKRVLGLGFWLTAAWVEDALSPARCVYACVCVCIERVHTPVDILEYTAIA